MNFHGDPVDLHAFYTPAAIGRRAGTDRHLGPLQLDNPRLDDGDWLVRRPLAQSRRGRKAIAPRT